MAVEVASFGVLALDRELSASVARLVDLAALGVGKADGHLEGPFRPEPFFYSPP